MSDENKDLVLLVRNADEKAYVRQEWLEEWQGHGWKLPEAAKAKQSAKPKAENKADQEAE